MREASDEQKPVPARQVRTARVPALRHPRMRWRTVLEFLQFADEHVTGGWDGLLDRAHGDDIRAAGPALAQWLQVTRPCVFEGAAITRESIAGRWVIEAFISREIAEVALLMCSREPGKRRDAQVRFTAIARVFREADLTERLSQMMTSVLVVYWTLGVSRGSLEHLAIPDDEKVRGEPAKKLRLIAEVVRRRLPRVMEYYARAGAAPEAALACFRMSTGKLNEIDHYAAITLCRSIVYGAWLAVQWSRDEDPQKWAAVHALCRRLDEDDRAAVLEMVFPVAVGLRTLQEHMAAPAPRAATGARGQAEDTRIRSGQAAAGSAKPGAERRVRLRLRIERTRPMTDASAPTLGFAVLYRWTLVPGKAAQFEAGWRAMTRLIRAESGGLGSRLHRCADGTWAAYAQWPSRVAWAQSEVTDPDATRWRTMMQDAVAERFEPILMEPVADLLVPVAGAGHAGP